MIRKATPKDAPHLAPLMYDAIHEIAYTLTGAITQDEALEKLAYWASQPANRLSYETIWVDEQDDQIAGLLIVYTGLQAEQLDAPLKQAVRELNPSADFDPETEGNVLYIDTVSVRKEFGGRGIGTALLQHAMHLAEELQVEALTLNVELSNTAARRLYERLGFQEYSTRTISGANYSYMVRKV
ncbi:GNAT family N-acetyltransferase [Chryseomicrobium excrementi]|uniref:GNAT family N-acetyltransferase n=1 Tax=Chryseomicrobium excrementi TaxID=2041346 RepID=A0A2M9EZL3_9BACL|nr:GNAT family N-acetyltransferase [Chryseomicrobium excrementi]PJK16640.1 GNAT family N-acetyltransferase [Chryseomicrobium excrementi]